MRKLLMLLVVSASFTSGLVAYAGALPENFDPNPETLVDLSEPVEFRWNGPGESQYPFVQYMLCFEDFNNSSNYACLNAGVKNYKKMSVDDWVFVDGEMTHSTGDIVKLNWYVQSYFSDGTSVDSMEYLHSDSWAVSYKPEEIGMAVDYVDEEEPGSGDYSKVEIVSFYEGANVIALDVKNQNIVEGDFYFAECVNQEEAENSFSDLRFISREQPDNYEDELVVQLMVGPLAPGVEYGCYAAIETPAALPDQYSVKWHSDWIYTSTLEGEDDFVAFELPPAGYEDEVVTRIEQYDNPFPDTDILELEGQAAGELYRRAILGGYPDGEFKGYRFVNRAEAAKFLLLARYGEIEEITGDGGFSDVLVGEWYARFVVSAANWGIINGYPDGTFKPADTVNIAEFLKMLTLTFSLEENLAYNYKDVSGLDWFARYAGIAQKYDLFPGSGLYLRPGVELTRDEVAVAIYQFLLNR